MDSAVSFVDPFCFKVGKELVVFYTDGKGRVVELRHSSDNDKECKIRVIVDDEI
jgi:hypothetical protein